MEEWDFTRSRAKEMDNFRYTIRVRYAQVDRMGVVYHSRYLEWFEAARTEMIRSMGLSYKSLEEREILLPVIEAFCRYRRPVLYDELIQVHTSIEAVSRSRIRLRYEIRAEGEKNPRATGYTVHCFMAPSGKPLRAGPEILRFFQNKMDT
jgi:acyl-CoA thioester hydrolase